VAAVHVARIHFAADLLDAVFGGEARVLCETMARVLTRTTFVHTVVCVKIDWDPRKAEANLREHGVSFAEAATVLTDDYALTREDQDSVAEQRFVSLGMSATGALLVVVYTHREPDIYRLISSWKANKPQRKQYEEGRR
jgi:uncharacterized protein